MSGVLHPVGPEPMQTYWVRRALVLAAAVVTLMLVVAIVVSIVRANSANAAGPQAHAGGLPAGSPSPTSSDGPATPAISPDVAPTPAPWPAGRTPSDAPPSATPPTKPGPTDTGGALCDPARLRATLTGAASLKVKQPATFSLSLINGGTDRCVVAVTPATFTLQIYSGKDRIWSSADCAALVRGVTTAVAPENAVEWKITWNGRRSATGCKARPEVPRPGYYVATATFSGAEPVRLRIQLHG